MELRIEKAQTFHAIPNPSQVGQKRHGNKHPMLWREFLDHPTPNHLSLSNEERES